MFKKSVVAFLFSIATVFSSQIFAQTLELPYLDAGACPFECCTYRQWIANQDTVLSKGMSDNSPVAFRVKKGEKVTGLTGVVITTKAGQVRALKNYTTPNANVSVKAGDILYLLTYRGEGFYLIWYKGKTFVDEFYRQGESAMLNEPESVWWVKIKNRRGQIGWTKQSGNFANQDACGSTLTVKDILSENKNNAETQTFMPQQYQIIQVPVQAKSIEFNFQISPAIQQYLDYYQKSGRAKMENGIYRSGMFMQMARRIFREEGVPENIAWLGQIASGWKVENTSGLWGINSAIGAKYELQSNAYVSEINSFEKATQAAARYLKYLAGRYNGNWELAMAAYFSGEETVDAAIKKADVADFGQIYQYLPKETSNFVPNILATILIANNPENYGFGNARPASPLQYDQIRVPASVNLNSIAKAAGTTLENLRLLNPELRTNTTPPKPYIIRVPAGKANEVVAIFKKMPSTNTSQDNTVKNTTNVRPKTLTDNELNALVLQMVKDDQINSDCLAEGENLKNLINVNLVDLNKDGKPEIEVRGEGCACQGARRCFAWLYSKTDDGYRLLLELGPADEITFLKTLSNGYLDIQYLVPTGNDFVIMTYTFDGKIYQERKCEIVEQIGTKKGEPVFGKPKPCQ